MNTVRLFFVLLLPVLGGCANYAPAPVIERSGAPRAANALPANAEAGMYAVKKGDTLYSIALDHGHDYKDVAAWNNLDNPDLIKIGQPLRVTPPDSGAPVAVSKPVSSSAPIEVKPVADGGNTDALKREPKGGKAAYSEDALARAQQNAGGEKPAAAEPAPGEQSATEKAGAAAAGNEVEWLWPANGKLLAPFAEGSSKGMDIAGKTGDPVLAAAGGVVSYAGTGLRGYGNLVVLRHNATWLSVYAHNSKILVKEKQAVTRGQKIAEMGSSDTESPRLHFEIRQQGKPVDPQKILPVR